MSENSFKAAAAGWWHAIGHGAWAIVAVMVIAAFIISGFILLLKDPLGLTVEIVSQPGWTLGMYAAQYGIGLCVLLLVPVMMQKMSSQKIRALLGILRQPRLKDFTSALLTFVPYFVVSYALQAIATALIPGFSSYQTQNVGFSGVAGGTQLVIVFVALVVLAPIAEELIFRGYLFGNAREGLSFWPAAILTSVLFGVVHGQWNVGLDTFALSMALCYLRERTGSIWAGVGLHAMKNALAFTLLFIFAS